MTREELKFHIRSAQAELSGLTGYAGDYSTDHPDKFATARCAYCELQRAIVSLANVVEYLES